MSGLQQLFKSSCSNRLGSWCALLCLLILGAIDVAHAVPVKGLYTAKAEVTDQAASTRREALPSMLTEVFGRVVGEPDPELLLQRWPVLKSEAQKAERYLAQFLYQRVNTGLEQSQLILRAEFEPSAINRLIQRLKLPQWGVDRPELLVVLAWQGDGRREVLASSPSSQIAAQLTDELETVTAGAGLPIALPLMDLQDQRAMPEQELRAGFTDGLMDVAARYGADAVLLGRIKVMDAPEQEAPLASPQTTSESESEALPAEELPVPLTFNMRESEMTWSLHQRNETTRYADSSNTVREGFQTGMWMAARHLAERYAVKGGVAIDPLAPEQVVLNDKARVNVLGINSLVDLKRVEKHLRGRTVVSEISLDTIDQVAGEALTSFTVTLKGSVAKLEQALAVGRLLSPTSKPQLVSFGDAQTQALDGSVNGSVAEPVENGAAAFEPEALPQVAEDMPELWYRLF